MAPRLLFIAGRCLALDICSDCPHRVHSGTSEEDPVTSGDVDYGV